MREVEIELSKVLAPELEEQLPDLGSKEKEISFSVRMAEAPICHALAEVFDALGMAIPPSLRLYDRFRLWLVPHRLGVLRRAGLAEPVSVGIEVEYVTEDATCSIAALLPSPEFLTYGSIGANVKLAGSVEASGACSPAGDIPVASEGAPTKAFAGLSFSAESGGSASVAFSADVVTPYISAVGLGSSRAEWRFNRHKEALFGRDIETWCLLAIPKRRKKLDYRMRFNLTTRTLFVPTRRESEWTDIGCTLG